MIRLEFFTISFRLILFICWRPYSIAMLILLSSLVFASSLGVKIRLWVSAVFVIVYVGGMMVLILYVSTLSASSKAKTLIIGGLITIRLIFLRIIGTRDLFIRQVDTCLFSLFLLSSELLFVTVVILYLLTTLFIRVNITQKFKGSLR